jgi:hypothetical protein
MNFEVYAPRTRAEGKLNTKPPIVGISNNKITMNKIALSPLSTGNAELSYDSELRTIKIRPVESGIKVKKRSIYARGFLKHFDIVLKGKFVSTIENDGCVYVTLPDAQEQVS